MLHCGTLYHLYESSCVGSCFLSGASLALKRKKSEQRIERQRGMMKAKQRLESETKEMDKRDGAELKVSAETSRPCVHLCSYMASHCTGQMYITSKYH